MWHGVDMVMCMYLIVGAGVGVGVGMGVGVSVCRYGFQGKFVLFSDASRAH